MTNDDRRKTFVLRHPSSARREVHRQALHAPRIARCAADAAAAQSTTSTSHATPPRSRALPRHHHRVFAEEKPATKPAAPPQPRVPEGVELKANLSYAGNDNPRQMVDLYLPKNRTTDKPLPVVLYIHGGGWSGGSRAGGGMAAGYAASGNYAGVSVGYRLSAEVKWPARIHDCKAAIRWIRGHAKEYNLDPDRIGVTGTSAGGHLVSLLGLTESVKDLRRQHRRIHQPQLEGDVRGELLRPDRHGRTADARRRGTEGRSRSGRAPRALGAREGLRSEVCVSQPRVQQAGDQRRQGRGDVRPLRQQRAASVRRAGRRRLRRLRRGQGVALGEMKSDREQQSRADLRQSERPPSPCATHGPTIRSRISSATKACP